MRYNAIAFILISSSVNAEEALLLFGGKNHDEFIGCLKCGKYQGKRTDTFM